MTDKNTSPVGWYVATYLLRFTQPSDENVDDPDARFFSWENTILIEAGGLDEAYEKAVRVASETTRPYKGGPEGAEVQWQFEGLTELLPVYEALGDGSEIMWAEHAPRKLKNLRKLVRRKDDFRQ